MEGIVPWCKLEETNDPQLSTIICAPAKLVRLAIGALFIKQKLGLTDDKSVHQIREKAYMQFSLGLAVYIAKAPFDSSIMVYCRERFSTAQSTGGHLMMTAIIRLYRQIAESITKSAMAGKSPAP